MRLLARPRMPLLQECESLSISQDDCLGENVGFSRDPLSSVPYLYASPLSSYFSPKLRTHQSDLLLPKQIGKRFPRSRLENQRKTVNPLSGGKREAPELLRFGRSKLVRSDESLNRQMES